MFRLSCDRKPTAPVGVEPPGPKRQDYRRVSPGTTPGTKFWRLCRVWVIAYLVSATALHSVAVAAHRSSRGGYRPAEEIDLQFRCRRDGATARPGPLFADKRWPLLPAPQSDLQPRAADPKASAPYQARVGCFLQRRRPLFAPIAGLCGRPCRVGQLFSARANGITSDSELPPAIRPCISLPSLWTSIIISPVGRLIVACCALRTSSIAPTSCLF
jgi:hypothetical protein